MITYRENILHGNKKFPVAFYRITPDHPRYQMAFHWHPEQEILYVVRGELRLTLNGNEFCAKEGDLFFIQGGTFHTGQAIGDTEYHCIVFDFDRMIPEGYAGKEFCRELESTQIIIDEFLTNGDSPLYKIYSDIARTVGERKSERGTPLVITGLLYRFMGELVLENKYRTVSRPTEHTMKTLSSIRNVLRKIETEYMNPITLASLAECANMSPNYFCRFFKQVTSRSPIDYLIVYRVNMAEYLLRTTDLAMTDISYSCGFNDVSHFIKYFRREKGVTPKKYRLIQRTERKSAPDSELDGEWDDVPDRT